MTVALRHALHVPVGAHAAGTTSSLPASLDGVTGTDQPTLCRHFCLNSCPLSTDDTLPLQKGNFMVTRALSARVCPRLCGCRACPAERDTIPRWAQTCIPMHWTHRGGRGSHLCHNRSHPLPVHCRPPKSLLHTRCVGRSSAYQGAGKRLQDAPPTSVCPIRVLHSVPLVPTQSSQVGTSPKAKGPHSRRSGGNRGVRDGTWRGRVEPLTPLPLL